MKQADRGRQQRVRRVLERTVMDELKAPLTNATAILCTSQLCSVIEMSLRRNSEDYECLFDRNLACLVEAFVRKYLPEEVKAQTGSLELNGDDGDEEARLKRTAMKLGL